MHWKLKAFIQNLVGALPDDLSNAAYYRIQRQFGALRRVNPTKTLRAVSEIADAVEQRGQSIQDAVVVEVGTGRRLNLPILMWLLGARRVVTTDLNPYLRPELVAEDLAFFRSHASLLEEFVARRNGSADRLEELRRLPLSATDLHGVCELCCIDYLAPADASQLPLPDGAVDLHVSTNVLEHVPPDALAAILTEGARVLGDDGLAVHRIDHSDHFWHSDESLSAIHFLRYSNSQWSRIAGNRFMYMNRLRRDDFEAIYAASQHCVQSISYEPDEQVLTELRDSPPPLDDQFADKPDEVLATLSSLFVSTPARAVPAAG